MQEHSYIGPRLTVPDAFAAAQAGDPARPLLTWYDDATGDRTELSGTTMTNWVAKTANLLVDGTGLGAGDTALVDAPPHWQTAAVLLGCWAAGLRVDIPAAAGVDVPAAGQPDVVFAAAARAGAYAESFAGGGVEIYGLALAPMAAPIRQLPPGVVDFITEVRGHGDEFRPVMPVTADQAATALASHAELCRLAAQRAEQLGIVADARVLLAANDLFDPLDWLLAPLLAPASLVLCANLDPTLAEQRVQTERVTVTLF